MMLNAHPEVVVPPESRFIVELWPGEDAFDRDAFLAALAEHPRFRVWELDLALVEEATKLASTYRDAIEGVYRAYATAHGKTVWGDKTPRYVESMPLLSSLWPDARFIHLVRDGRNVALSYGNLPFGPKTLAKAAELWAERVTTGMDEGVRLGPERYLELRYEDLVDDPDAGARSLCSAIGVDFDPQMLNYAEHSKDQVLSRAAKYNPNVTSAPVASSDTWHTRFSRTQLEIFEQIAGEVLERCGYERATSGASLSARVRAGLGRAGLPVDRLKPR